MEKDLQEKMELNWRLMHLVDRSIEERNVLYGLLSQIQQVVDTSGQTALKKKIKALLTESPEELDL